MTSPGSRVPPLDYDAVVVGAGVVGLACAARLAASRRVLLVDRARTFGTETSSRSSQVIHAGLYYPTGSLKARLCVAGNASLYAFCAARGIPHQRVGKLIVATDAAEEPHLHALLRRGEDNGVPGLRLLSGREVRALAPAVRATAAILSETTGIVDSHGVMAALAADARAAGADAAYRHGVVGAHREGDAYRIALRDDRGDESTVRAAALVNAAGLDADGIAALPGLDVRAAGYEQRFVKGSYFRLRRALALPHLIYPVPAPGLAGLGVHVTLELDGAVRLGPDVEPLPDRRRDYRVDEGRRPAFHRAVSRYLDGVAEDDLLPDTAGIRPRLAAFAGPSPDFIVAHEADRGLSGWVNLVGIESPGLTCALELAREVEQLLP